VTTLTPAHRSSGTASKEAAPRSPKTAPAMVPAVTRAMAVLDLLAEQREPMGLARLAGALALPKSSMHGICNTLCALGYLNRQGDGSYFIGARVMGLANAFLQHNSVVQEFNQFWNEAGIEPEETIILSVLDGSDVVYVAARQGRRPLGLAFHVGMRLPAHLASTGKAMLAFHEPEFVDRLLPEVLPGLVRGRPTPTRRQLHDELAQVRERGYSIDDESVREGVYCIGAPVFDAAGKPLAGIGVCIQKAMLEGGAGEPHRDAVTRVAGQLSQRLGGRAPMPLKGTA
jgi:DNA-binding IclR family transcriptional regulator